MDLFIPSIPPEQFHPNFRNILSPFHAAQRELLNRWAEKFVDRDGKFVKEFQSTFNSSFWELYLSALFQELKFEIDWSHQSPDFLLSKNNVTFCVEATTSNAADGKPKEWEKDMSPYTIRKMRDMIPTINREATIRLANAITSKFKKYNQTYKKLNHVSGKPYVIAVAPFEQPFFNMQYDRPIQSLLYDYYVDEEAAQAHPEIYGPHPPGISLGTITKENGSEIELGFFNSNIMEEVSAIIFSCVATWGKIDALSGTTESMYFWGTRLDQFGRSVPFYSPKENYTETIEDGLQIFHNPNAKYPLNPSLFSYPRVIQHYFDKSADDWVHEGRNNSLVSRQVLGIMPQKDSEK